MAESAADRDLGGELVRALSSLRYPPLSPAEQPEAVQPIFFNFLVFLTSYSSISAWRIAIYIASIA